MFKAVFDTNIFISSLISPWGACSKLLDYTEYYQLVISEQIMEEILETLTQEEFKEKYGITDEIIENFLEVASSEMVLVYPKKKVKVCSDPRDDKFIEAALAGEANFIVSGDNHLLSIREYKNIKIITPRNFLEKLKESM